MMNWIIRLMIVAVLVALFAIVVRLATAVMTWTKFRGVSWNDHSQTSRDRLFGERVLVTRLNVGGMDAAEVLFFFGEGIDQGHP